MTLPLAQHPAPSVLPVAQLLSLKLNIPAYQRPYKWTGKHLAQLFDDLASFEEAQAYRLGTLVFHRNNGQLDIVDGQQRTLTLWLIVQALSVERSSTLTSRRLVEQLEALKNTLSEQTFSRPVSITNLQLNYQAIRRLVRAEAFSEARIDFLLNRCEVVCFVLDDISEAFQFFDSQNARGRDLEPHDLLKAYHLREFDPADEDLKATAVAEWENTSSRELARLFGEYLYRIRRWVKGRSARYFAKEEVGLFKGVNLATAAPYPYVEQLRITHHWVDHYNRQPERRIDRQALGFPFHLDQTIVNGRRFFEMASHYRRLLKTVTSGKVVPDAALTPGRARDILRTLEDYPGRHRKGDRYVRGLFDCLLVCYLDRFGTEDIGRAVEKAFVWAYHVRLERTAVQVATVDNHVLAYNLFRVIQAAAGPREFFSYPLPKTQVTRDGEVELLALFRELKTNE